MWVFSILQLPPGMASLFWNPDFLFSFSQDLSPNLVKSYLSTVEERSVKVLELSPFLLPVLMLLSLLLTMTKPTCLHTVNPDIFLACHAVLPDEYSLDPRVEQSSL